MMQFTSTNGYFCDKVIALNMEFMSRLWTPREIMVRGVDTLCRKATLQLLINVMCLEWNVDGYERGNPYILLWEPINIVVGTKFISVGTKES
ncbi:hypothetical protein Igag_1978 [Ignisphaera aggregans DSM 17230]|uniref:Uncharacterized protein n=1 Tax=Ignisphaera aggregans (strain DSM 17230 / JCM 13409 / AQ1.S1) TaxID=583356 RepID=E0STI4_IGNAA|nr:hypothetical protein Igag_1978 [Ignisphaera aggregans DSM 17230]